MSHWPTVNPGDPMKAQDFMDLVAIQRANVLLRGKGVRLRNTPDGTIVSALPVSVSFASPFLCSLSGTTTMNIRAGTINGTIPLIGKIPLGGDAKNAPPTLTIKPQLNDDGRGWVALEVTFTAKWDAVSAATIVQVADLTTDTGIPSPSGANSKVIMAGVVSLPRYRARHPLAMISRASDGTLSIFQNTYFNLQCAAAVTAKNASVARVFFWPA